MGSERDAGLGGASASTEDAGPLDAVAVTLASNLSKATVMNVAVKMSNGASRRSSHQRRMVRGLRPVMRAKPCCVIPRTAKAARRSKGVRMGRADVAFIGHAPKAMAMTTQNAANDAAAIRSKMARAMSMVIFQG